MQLPSVLSGVSLGISMGAIMDWVLWGTLGLALIFVFAAIYYMSIFNIKVELIQLLGSTKDGVFVLGKTRKNRVRYVSNGTEWRSLWPLMNSKSIEPFEDKFIHNKRSIRAFEVGEVWVPCELKVSTTGESKSWFAELTPVPHYIRNWQSLAHKKHNFEFAQNNFWEENKNVIMGVIAVALCLVLCGATIYMTYTFAAPNADSWTQLTNAIKDISVVQGIGPR